MEESTSTAVPRRKRRTVSSSDSEDEDEEHDEDGEPRKKRKKKERPNESEEEQEVLEELKDLARDHDIEIGRQQRKKRLKTRRTTSQDDDDVNNLAWLVDDNDKGDSDEEHQLVHATAPKTSSPTPAVVLAFFYESVVGEPKTKEQISDIIEKRRRSSPKWFETLCSKLQKKYGKSPVDAYKEKQTKEEAVAAEAAKAKSETAQLAPALSAENKEAAAQAMTPALEQLAAVFREQHNREPTEEERGRWQASFEAAVAGAQNSSVGVGKEAGAEGALPSFGAQQ